MLTLTPGELPTSAGELPVEHSQLIGNQPNPANSSTVITYEIPFGTSPLPVELKVYTASGAPVATLVDQVQLPGTYSVVFDTSRLTSGIYYYSLRVDHEITHGRMVIVR